MKRFLGVFLIVLGLALRHAEAVMVELHNIADGRLSSQINFDADSSGCIYQVAHQYLKLENHDSAEKTVRIYADAPNWRAATAAGTIPLETYPLHSIGFSQPQEGGGEFDSDSEAEWQKIRGVADKNSEAMEVTLAPNESRYVYFGAKTPTTQPGTLYQTKILVEVLNGEAAFTNVRPDKKLFTPNGDGVNDAVTFGATGNFQIKIFDMQGKVIRTLENINVWDGRGDNGSLVSAGAYLYQVKTQATRVSGILAVAR